MDHAETSDSTLPAGDRDIRKVEFDALYQIEVSESLTRAIGRVQSRGHAGMQSRRKTESRDSERGR